MVDFKRAPGADGEGLHLLQATVAQQPAGGEGLFTLEQWAIIAGAGMAVSLLMMVVGLVLSWRKSRRQRTGAARR